MLTFIITLFFILIFISLGSGVVFIAQGKSKSLLQSLMCRVGLSIGLFILILGLDQMKLIN